MSGLSLAGLFLWARDVSRARAFYAQWKGWVEAEGGFRLPDGILWRVCSGRGNCSTRGPHGVVPALAVEDVAQAKAWLQAQGRPLVFEEVVPGLARLTFIDPEGNPVDVVQEVDVAGWQRGQRIPAASDSSEPPRVLGLFELSLYTHDVPRAQRVYQEGLGLTLGLAYFAHIHLLFDNVPLVLRPTWHRCPTQEPHTPALLLLGEALPTCRVEGLTWKPLNLCYTPCSGCHDGEYTWVCRMGEV
ncbi:MAG: hypothetical protein GXO55_10925 [Chloroflexi bacterium]|nr:hypothetical protein [Chloroflexota bacterium]